MGDVVLGMEVARWVLLALAALWFLRRLMAKRVGDERTCRQCGYILENLPETSDRCPECGQPLNAPHATRTGRRLPVGRTAMALAAAIGIWVAVGFVTDVIEARELAFARRPSELREAASSGNVAEIMRLVSLEPGLAKRAAKGSPWPPSYYAVASGSAEAVDLLLDAEQAKPPFRFRTGVRALCGSTTRPCTSPPRWIMSACWQS